MSQTYSVTADSGQCRAHLRILGLVSLGYKGMDTWPVAEQVVHRQTWSAWAPPIGSISFPGVRYRQCSTVMNAGELPGTLRSLLFYEYESSVWSLYEL